MRFEAPIWEAASTDASRPVLTGVWFDANEATLAATDSYCAAVIPCEVEDGDESGLIPAAALKASWQKDHGRLAVWDGKAVLRLADGAREWKLLGGAFPNIAQIAERALHVAGPFGINPELMLRLGTALGAGKKTNRALELHPMHALRPMRVETVQGWGILMPVRLATGVKLSPDFSDDDVLTAAIEAASRSGSKAKKREAFRAAAMQATVELAKAVTVTTV